MPQSIAVSHRRGRWAASRRAAEATYGLERRIKHLTIVGVVALALLNAADAVTTHLFLLHAPAGGLEANPLAGLLLASGSLLLVKMAIVAALGIAVLWDRPRLGLLVGTWTVSGLYLAAVISNILLLRMV